MKKTKCMIIILLLVSYAWIYAGGSDFSFVGFGWNASQEQALKSIGMRNVKLNIKGMLSQNKKVFGVNSFLIYTFTSDKLDSILIQPRVKTKELKTAFDKYLEELTKIYGSPAAVDSKTIILRTWDLKTSSISLMFTPDESISLLFGKTETTNTGNKNRKQK